MLTLLLAALTFAAGDSTVYPVYNHGRLAGSMVVRRSGDSVVTRYVFTDRNRGTRVEMRYAMRGDSVIGIESRPVLADGSAGEPMMSLAFVGDSVRQVMRGRTSVQRADPSVYYSLQATPYDQVLFAQRLLRSANHSAKLSGNRTAHLDVINETTVPTAHGNEHVRLVAIDVGGGTPQVLWLDSHDGLFATEVGWFMTVKPGSEPALPTLRTIETAYRDRQAEALQRQLVEKSNGTIAITHGDLFDADRGVLRHDMTVVIDHDRIASVGPADSVAVPSGATVIDAHGKTVMPGMWDMHGHMQLTSENLGGPMQLSRGITTVRDLASDIDVATAERARADKGLIASPRQVLAGFMEGPGAWAGPTSTIVRTEAEAREWVAKYDSMGYKQIKLYNMIHPDLVPTIAAEAHKRGMRLSGHIPRGLSVPAAVLLGYDEIQHAAFLMSTFYQDSLYVPTMRAYSLVATTVAPNVDPDGQPFTDLIGFLKDHHTVIDGTWAIWVTSTDQGIAQAVGAGASTDAQKADAHYMRLLKRLYDAGVTLVPGTDAFGSSTYNNELELYERVGIPAATVLQIATIVPARVMGEDKDYGSIAPGKVADVIIVDKSPLETVKNLRTVRTVIRAGRVYEVQAVKGAIEPGAVKPGE